jgi:F-type H+-transporting ATPase subunit gamma
MPSLKTIRKRIASVKNTQKITRAMKLIAAARLRKSQEAIVAARPYAQALEQVIAELANYAGRDSHPLLQERGKSSAVVVAITSDRGLAGGFNSQLIRRVELLMRTDLADYDSVRLRLLGRKANAYFSRRDTPIASFAPGPASETALDVARAVANDVVGDFLDGDSPVDRIFVVYNEFKSAISQKPVARQLLPIEPAELPAGMPRSGDFVYEPSKQSLLEHLVPLYVQNWLFRAALESIASEFGARMSAMDSATRNAGQMIDRLTLVYNRARQAAITKELLEIIAGAEALKG